MNIFDTAFCVMLAITGALILWTTIGVRKKEGPSGASFFGFLCTGLLGVSIIRIVMLNLGV